MAALFMRRLFLFGEKGGYIADNETYHQVDRKENI